MEHTCRDVIGINHDQPIGLGQATLGAEGDRRTRVTPGTSALFLTSEDAVGGRVAFAGTNAELIRTNRKRRAGGQAARRSAKTTEADDPDADHMCSRSDECGHGQGELAVESGRDIGSASLSRYTGPIGRALTLSAGRLLAASMATASRSRSM